jgi:predicted amidohydrolase
VKDFTIAIGQWPVVPSRDENLDRAERFLRAAAREGAALCVLPEMFQTPYELDLMERAAEPSTGPSLTRIREAARELRLHVVAGSFPEREGRSIYNASFLVGPDGGLLGRHRKIHLFDVSLAEVKVKESAVLSPGDAPLIAELPFCRLGVAICYDVRFPEIFRAFESARVDVIALPAAFSRTTGAAHWHLLLRSRAVDCQAYVAAACPAPVESSKYVTYGHSLVADPWGAVLGEAGEGEEAVVVRLEAARLERVRRELPVLAHRRPDLYERWRSSQDGISGSTSG